MTTPTDAQVLAALEVLGWPDDRERSAHIEPDGYEITPARHYWDHVTSVLTAADGASAATRAYIDAALADDRPLRDKLTIGTPARRAMATQRIAVLPDPPKLAQVDVDNAWNRGYERGVAEGRRQATEGWELHADEEQWSVWWNEPGGGLNVSVPRDADDPERAARAFQAEHGGEVKRRRLRTLESPWKSAEQDGADRG